jgi:DNA-binding IclR family transcriptional regulator
MILPQKLRGLGPAMSTISVRPHALTSQSRPVAAGVKGEAHVFVTSDPGTLVRGGRRPAGHRLRKRAPGTPSRPGPAKPSGPVRNLKNPHKSHDAGATICIPRVLLDKGFRAFYSFPHSGRNVPYYRNKGCIVSSAQRQSTAIRLSEPLDPPISSVGNAVENAEAHRRRSGRSARTDWSESTVHDRHEEHSAGGSGIHAIARAAELLRLLHANPGGLSQPEVGERLGMPRSTVSRLLNSLVDEGLVSLRATRGPYQLGPEMARMANTVRLSLVMDVHPFLEELSRELNETVDFSILEGDRVTFLDQVVSGHRLRAISAVGESFPLHCSANGKALLATLSPAQRAAALPSRLTRLTANTITNAAQLCRELTLVALHGVAFDREEQTAGVCAVAAVLPWVADQVVAVSVPVPAQRFYGRERELARAVRAWVATVNARLGNAAGEGAGSGRVELTPPPSPPSPPQPSPAPWAGITHANHGRRQVGVEQLSRAEMPGHKPPNREPRRGNHRHSQAHPAQPHPRIFTKVWQQPAPR